MFLKYHFCFRRMPTTAFHWHALLKKILRCGRTLRDLTTNVPLCQAKIIPLFFNPVWGYQHSLRIFFYPSSILIKGQKRWPIISGTFSANLWNFFLSGVFDCFFYKLFLGVKEIFLESFKIMRLHWTLINVSFIFNFYHASKNE